MYNTILKPFFLKVEIYSKRRYSRFTHSNYHKISVICFISHHLSFLDSKFTIWPVCSDVINKNVYINRNFMFQLSECFRKLVHPPTSTHYTFKLNDSIYYPSVTICRNPGFKTDLFPVNTFKTTC